MIKLLLIFVTCLLNFTQEKPIARNTALVSYSEVGHVVRFKRAEAAQIVEGMRQGSLVAGQIASTFAETKDLLKAGSTMLKLVSGLSAILPAALSAIAAVFSLISSFLPQEESAELQAIKNGFKEMHDRFDQVGRQIDQLGAKLDYIKALVPYQQVRDNLENVIGKYELLTKEPASSGFKKNFIAVCENPSTEPQQALQKLHRIIVKRGPEDLPHIVPTIINHVQLDYKIVMGWFERIATDAYRLGTLQSACFGIVHKKDKVGMKTTTELAGKLVQEIIAELVKYEKQFTTLGPEFLPTFKNELMTVLQNAKADPAGEKTIDDQCRTMPGVAIDSQQASVACIGFQPISDIKVAVNMHLRTKYPWLKFLIYVYIEADVEKDNPCHGDNDAINHFVLAKSSNKRAFVTWSRPHNLVDINIHNAIYLLRNHIKDEQVTSDFIGVSTQAIKSLIKESATMFKTPYLFCTIGGYRGTFIRSIFSNGIGSFKFHWSDKYIVDYIFSFYKFE